MSVTGVMQVFVKVSDVDRALAFYRDVLGFELQANLGSAAFLSAGGYHHHLGVNTWQSQGAPAPPEGALGLDRYELVLPSADERDSAADRLAHAGADPVSLDEGVVATDPSGNRVLLSALQP